MDRQLHPPSSKQLSELHSHHPHQVLSTNSFSSVCSVVAVHGLGGDAIETWTHPRSNAFWLKDILPAQIPDARILTFGYNAAAAFGRSTSDVIDHAKSLLGSLVDKRDELEVYTSNDEER
jgi:hypothetical protein